jgi:DNA-binding transcriptional ArsR family regulator
MTDLDRSDWRRVLTGLEDPAVGRVAEGLADVLDIDVHDAYDAVDDAIDGGVLVEEECESSFSAVRLADDDPDETPDTAALDTREGGSEADNPQGETDETADTDASGDKYRRIYRDAAEAAGREQWEYVEEAAIRDALEARGFAELLDNGDLFHVRDWRVVDVSDQGEDPQQRWYYPSGSETRPEEFRRFDQLLTEAAPDDYEPHYFRVAKAGKDPATQYGGWKDENARLSVEEAVDWMKEGGNVGIAGTSDDALINVDIDDDEATTPGDVPTSLRAISRSRTGWHTWYFDEDGDVPNIPTDQYGEIRTDWQYVVAPGSFVASTAEEIPDGADAPGYYTVEDEDPVATIGYDDLPEVFREAAEASDPVEEDSGEEANTFDPDDAHDGGDTSAVFDVEASDLVTENDASRRFGSIFHNSSTGTNMSVSGNKVHCWRHGVAHGGLQALATLSDEVDEGCGELGKAHKNSGDGNRSGAGRNRLKGDWKLVWAAWHEAKDRGAIPTGDPVPYRALRGVAVRDDLVDEEDLVERETDDGSYTALPDAAAYNAALEHISDEYGLDPGREPVDGRSDADDDPEEWRDDPRDVSATVDFQRAWDAAGRVTPSEVDALAAATDNPDKFACPETGDAVNIVRAVAVAEGITDGPREDLDGDAYPKAYAAAREEYGAPLPRYYTTSDAVAEFDAVLDVISEATYWDLDADRLETEETARDDDVDGAAEVALDPSWRESESGESVLVFPSGTVWDADTERVLDVVRFAALDAGIIHTPNDPLKGSDFTDAYGAARQEYGAPLPRWEPAADGAREITAQLPPSEELLDARDVDGVDTDILDDAREDVEALIRDTTSDTGAPSVVRALPATGKTTGTVKTAAERPLSYLAGRKELQQQALDKAERWGVDARILPVLSDESIDDEVLSSAVAHVREHGKDRLRDIWGVLSHAVDDADDITAGDIYTDDDDDEDTVDLDRATCPTAEGDHGPAWGLAVHVARALGYAPKDIHTQAHGLFGAELPCSDGETCTYSEGWDRVNDADDTADLLVGDHIHAHVAGARTAFSRDVNGQRTTEPRAVVLDEFPGEAYVREFGDHADDHATWLARSLRDDIKDRRDLFQSDAATDDWVQDWLAGAGDQHGAVDDALDALERVGALFDAEHGAEKVLEEVPEDALKPHGLLDPLRAAGAGEANASTFRDLNSALDRAERDNPGLAGWIEDAVLSELANATDDGNSNPTTDALDDHDLPVAGDLADLVDSAIEAATEHQDTARARVKAAITALKGGAEGCRRLAAWADDGYAHPDAHHLLEAVLGDGDRIHTSDWAFDPEATDGTTLDVVDTHDRATAVHDRNGHGALLHTPPARTDAGGADVPYVGLDATGRAELWTVALGDTVDLRDIHDTDAERAQFLEDALDLRVIQAADRPRYYEGNPASKDTDGDVALLERLSEEYAGIEAPRERGDAATVVGNPAAITTKGVRDVLETDDRLDDVVDTWEHYGNVKGSNDLGDQRLAAVLGCQHYGDHAIERFAALAGEEVDTDRRSGRGDALEYGSDVAEAYLAHMTDDQTMQSILRFARGDSGATVVARTSALRDDLPVVGDGQVVETWSDTATTIAREYRRLGREFTTADVRDVVDVTPRQVRRVLAELADAGYVRRVEEREGRATTYERVDDPGAGEVDLPEREDAVATRTAPVKEYYTWNVRVRGGDSAPSSPDPVGTPEVVGAPPAPDASDGVGPRS